MNTAVQRCSGEVKQTRILGLQRAHEHYDTRQRHEYRRRRILGLYFDRTRHDARNGNRGYPERQSHGRYSYKRRQYL